MPAPRFTPGIVAAVSDAPGAQTFDIAEGAGLTLVGTDGENVFGFEQVSGAFEVSREDNRLVLPAEDGAVTRLPPDMVPQTLVFADGAVTLTLDGETILLGDVAVDETPAAITAGLDDTTTVGKRNVCPMGGFPGQGFQGLRGTVVAKLLSSTR